MNTHKTLSLLAAVLVTAGQALVFALDTAATTGEPTTRSGYEAALDSSVASAGRATGHAAGHAADQRLAG